MPKRNPKSHIPAPICLCILAGGLSTRMGRDKARIRLGRRTLLGHVRAAAVATGHPVKIIRRDLVPRCGPLGGVLTALKKHKHRAQIYLFLSCDAPFITTAWLKKLIATHKKTKTRALFTELDNYASFPFLLTAETFPIIEAQLARQEYSLQSLARSLKAEMLPAPAHQTDQFLNVNTPESLGLAQARVRSSKK